MSNKSSQPSQQLFTLSSPTPDPYDPGTFYYPVDFSKVVPASFDPRAGDVPIEDQQQIGDCTDNAYIGSAGRFLKFAGKFVQLSEDFQYQCAGYIANGGVWPTVDLGSTPILAGQAAVQFGICTEATWPSPATFNPTPPSAAALKEALNYKGGTLYRVNQPTITLYDPSNEWFTSDYLLFAIKYAISMGHTVQMAFEVGDAIFAYSAGDVYQPINPTLNPDAKGAHEVEIMGWQPSAVPGVPDFICRNSWGTSWGDKGYFLCSIGVLDADAFEFTVLTGFNGYTTTGVDLVQTLPAPTPSTSLSDLITYIFKNKFGRYPQPAGIAAWEVGAVSIFNQQIIDSAQGADRAYYTLHGASTAYAVPTAASTVQDLITYVFQTNFGRLPAAPGIAYWAAHIISVLTAQIVSGASQSDIYYMQANS
jgi:Papain family cysteine protease